MSIETRRAPRSCPPSRIEALEPRIFMDAALLGPPIPYHAHLYDTVLPPPIPNVGTAPIGAPLPYHAHLFDTVLAPPAGNTRASVPAIQLVAASVAVPDIAILSVQDTLQPSLVLAPAQVAQSTPVVAPDVLSTLQPIDNSPLPPALFGPNGATECSHG